MSGINIDSWIRWAKENDIGLGDRWKDFPSAMSEALAVIDRLRARVRELEGRWETEYEEDVLQAAEIAKADRYRKALEEIANHPHNSYDAVQDSQSSPLYNIGVVDGHRCAAQVAREALKEGKKIASRFNSERIPVGLQPALEKLKGE